MKLASFTIPCAFPLPLSPEARKEIERFQRQLQAQDPHQWSEVPALDASAFPGWAVFDTREWEAGSRIEHNRALALSSFISVGCLDNSNEDRTPAGLQGPAGGHPQPSEAA